MVIHYHFIDKKHLKQIPGNKDFNALKHGKIDVMVSRLTATQKNLFSSTGYGDETDRESVEDEKQTERHLQLELATKLKEENLYENKNDNDCDKDEKTEWNANICTLLNDADIDKMIAGSSTDDETQSLQISQLQRRFYSD